jgi:hypothetical protein
MRFAGGAGAGSYRHTDRIDVDCTQSDEARREPRLEGRGGLGRARRDRPVAKGVGSPRSPGTVRPAGAAPARNSGSRSGLGPPPRWALLAAYAVVVAVEPVGVVSVDVDRTVDVPGTVA